jgi:hypothetical protein
VKAHYSLYKFKYNGKQGFKTVIKEYSVFYLGEKLGELYYSDEDAGIAYFVVFKYTTLKLYGIKNWHTDFCVHNVCAHNINVQTFFTHDVCALAISGQIILKYNYKSVQCFGIILDSINNCFELKCQAHKH